jgi:polysaccharide export outer membrane protein
MLKDRRFVAACNACLLFSLGLSLWIAAAPALAQKAGAGPQAASSSNSAKAENLVPDYAIGPGDVLTVSVADAPEMSGKIRVTDSGFLILPSLSTPVKAEGLTALELERRIAEAVKAADLIREPVVSVFVEEYHSRTVTVLGAVAKPSVYPLERATTVLELLSMAGGVTQTAGPSLTITRQLPPAGAAAAKGDEAASSAEKSTLSIDLNNLMSGKDPSLNVDVRSGDVVSVSTAPVIYVVGAVNKPGAFVLQDQQASMTAIKAMGLVGGLTPVAAGNRSIIIRKSADGQEKQLPIDLTKLMRGKLGDQALLGGDVLFVPDSRMKKNMEFLGQTAHTAVYAITLAAGYSIIR